MVLRYLLSKSLMGGKLLQAFGDALGPHYRDVPFHIAIVRSPLTRSLPSRFGDVRDEIVTACGEFIGNGDGKSQPNLQLWKRDLRAVQSGKVSQFIEPSSIS